MAGSDHLASALLDSRSRTLELVGDLDDPQLRVPLMVIVNPILWEIGHVGWFQERWILRHLGGARPMVDDADRLWDSFRVAHDTRWELPLQGREETLKYMKAILDRAIDRLPSGEPGRKVEYFYRLVTYHEDMHGEALTYTRQTLEYSSPAPRPGIGAADAGPGGPWPGDVEVAGGEFQLGSRNDGGFVFDNEKWAHPVQLRPFAIARAPVTQRQFADFVEDGGYRRRQWWGSAGWDWKERVGAEHPVYWRKDTGGAWLRRAFDRSVRLEEHLPVHHVNWYEAEAWCNWAGRRLPTEAEWEMAASERPDGGKDPFPWGDDPPTPGRANLDALRPGCLPVDALPAGDTTGGCRQMIGNVWEWTSSDFAPFPGFLADPYKEYSQPWFGCGYKVLRGGAWLTRSRMLRNSWRNFFTSDRRDIYGGFRTCAR